MRMTHVPLGKGMAPPLLIEIDHEQVGVCLAIRIPGHAGDDGPVTINEHRAIVRFPSSGVIGFLQPVVNDGISPSERLIIACFSPSDLATIARRFEIVALGEIDDRSVIQSVSDNTLMIYIKTSAEDEAFLIKRAETHPKPLYYREPFLDQQLANYYAEHGLEYSAQIDPSDFVSWVFPRLFRARLPRYESIIEEHGYVISARDAFEVSNAEEFLTLIGDTLA